VSRPAERVFVWLGGTVFVTALAFCAYSYVVRWAAPLPGPPMSIAADVVLFSLFAAHHSLFARDGVKARLAAIVPLRLMRSVYVWAASLLLILACALWQPIGGDVYDVTGWRAIVHAGVQLAGLGVIASSVRAIDALELAGIHHGPETVTLQITGPYRWVRHPLYFGWMLAVFGAAHMTGDRLAFAVISSFYLVVAIPWEERALARGAPDAYARYKERVRWRVVPYVY
jgi:protein-S-isoprenylcysteine O-methyltransferase Ste14